MCHVGDSRTRKKVLIIGGDSRIGQACAERVRDVCDVLLTSRNDHYLFADKGRIRFDLVQPSEPVLALEPDCVLLCAAITSIQKCAEQPENTGKINVDAPIQLARHYASKGAHIIFFSTNEVFDGTTPHVSETTPHNPKNVYGAQKAEVEKFLKEHIRDSLVIRLSKVVAGDEPLWSKWISSLRSGNPIKPFHDRYLTPVLLDAVSAVVLEACKRRAIGIIQLSGEKDRSYAEVAVRLSQKLDVPETLVEPVSAESVLGPVYSPRYTSLDTSRAEVEFGFRPSVLDGVVELLIKAN